MFEIVKIACEIENTDIVLCGKEFAYFERSYKEFQIELDKYYTIQFVDDLLTVEDDILSISITKDNLQVTVGGYRWLEYNERRY